MVTALIPASVFTEYRPVKDDDVDDDDNVKDDDDNHDISF